MSELTIISPHRDDVPFSLYLSLSRWRSLPLKLNVATVFTVSTYAPRATAGASGFVEDVRSFVTSIRKREDRRVFTAIDKAIRTEDFRFLDAPLRLEIISDVVCRPQGPPIESRPEVDMLSQRLRKYFLRGLVLAPLALGDHFDHLTVRAAAIKTLFPHKLGFYEDLPYATWVSEGSLRKVVSYAEHSTGMPLKSFLVRRKGYIFRKRSIVSRYQSQISRNEAVAIARFAVNYGGGERIWIPKHCSPWRSLSGEAYA
ncbi:MAG: hypothetical protein ACR2JB_14870 [Bryobacteraceae bacterium]